jgi:hypothetical protein
MFTGHDVASQSAKVQEAVDPGQHNRMPPWQRFWQKQRHVSSWQVMAGTAAHQTTRRRWSSRRCHWACAPCSQLLRHRRQTPQLEGPQGAICTASTTLRWASWAARRAMVACIRRHGWPWHAVAPGGVDSGVAPVAGSRRAQGLRGLQACKRSGRPAAAAQNHWRCLLPARCSRHKWRSQPANCIQ